ncbi:DUF4040 domain-containing protein [Pontibacter sp. E15-1]|uniref:hydrogen gas-evolving membrane-bound hydrogenase subunit E n=1 Tax=Pontibacter sp. E15-1 TaxID=2919918 RepID=UPI001F504040|nr:hydrogen gas-evolving membrane-bound hydrogenase subunit E [Pontibacter sp. E15-1]MCJ8163652.1 DUF4040 domain-containing protein [Pontibacter sp. E15-1]
MVYLLLTGFLVAFAAPLLHHWLGRRVFVPLTLLPLIFSAYFIWQVPGVLAGETVTQSISWVPSLGVQLQFRLDGLSLLFALLVSVFGVLIMLYSRGYMGETPLLGRFYMYLTLFMVAMLGIVISDNFFCLFLFWELTSITSYLLIGFHQHKSESRTAAWQALLVTGAGGLALFAGLLLLGQASGEITFSGMMQSGMDIRGSSLYLPAMVLVMLGCFTKSAQFPFHFWLPNAMAAPTPVSAYLHSATMVKAGIYLLARLSPVFNSAEIWQFTLPLVGGITAVMGAALALKHTDLKAVLAYTTISALGLLVMLLGIGTDEATKAALVFLVAHALYKGTLFMVAGTLDHCTGTRQLPLLKGLGRRLPWVGAAATLAAYSMAGVYPSLGFVGKELLYESALHNNGTLGLVLGVALLAGMVFVAIALVLSFRIFWRKSSHPIALQHAASPYLFLPPLLLGLASLAGVSATTPLLLQASLSIAPELHTSGKLVESQGFSLVVQLSALTTLLGLILYLFTPRLHLRPFTTQDFPFGPDSLYHLLFSNFLSGSKRFIHTLQDGYLRHYLVYLLLFFCGLSCYVLWRDALVLHLGDRFYMLQSLRLYEVVLFILVVSALLLLLNTRSRLTSIVVMGLVGYSAALFYILFGAPDVAATQLLIETLTVVIFVLLLHKLPAFSYLSHQVFKLWYVFVAVLFGSVMTYVLLLVQENAVSSDLKDFYGEASYLQAHGRNMVNVILVDFRGLDTLGEITVLAVAAVGVYALLRLKPQKGGKP